MLSIFGIINPQFFIIYLRNDSWGPKDFNKVFFEVTPFFIKSMSLLSNIYPDFSTRKEHAKIAKNKSRKVKNFIFIKLRVAFI